VRLIVLRQGDERYETPDQVQISVGGGLEGDRWAQAEKLHPELEITMMNRAAAALVCDGRLPLYTPGDNLLVDFDLSEEVLPVGTRIRVGDAVLEVSKKAHLGCKKFKKRFGKGALRWVNHKSQRSRRLRGINCKVVEPGLVRNGDSIEVWG
jgi:MOSC domain-containing protein YiiM